MAAGTPTTCLSLIVALAPSCAAPYPATPRTSSPTPNAPAARRAGTAPGPAATPNQSEGPSSRALDPDLELHWAGVTVYDFQAAYDLYAALFNLPQFKDQDWAMLREKDGMTLELFRTAVAPDPKRAWGRGQAVRLGLVTRDLDESVALWRTLGASIGGVGSSPWGRQVEVTGTEGIRFGLLEGDRDGPKTPCVRIAEIKAADLPAQRGFYSDVMGLPVTSADSERVVMSQHAAGPHLSLVSGGTRAPEGHAFDPKAVDQAIFLSFKTHDIHAAARYFGSTGTQLLSKPTHYPWGGTVFFVADADANAVQVVQYD